MTIPAPPHKTGERYRGLRQRIDPAQIPSPIENAERDEAQWAASARAVFPTLPGTRPPLATTAFAALDQGSASPRFVRVSTWSLPHSARLAAQCRLPLAAEFQPFADQDGGEERVPLVAELDNEDGPPRCARCRAYINPWCPWTDGGGGWRCNLCAHTTPVAPAYFSPLGPNLTRADHAERPELNKGTVDFAVGRAYWAQQPAPHIDPLYTLLAPPPPGNRAPLPLAHLFALDVSRPAVASGFLRAACHALRAALPALPGPLALLTFDRTLHFYDLRTDPAPLLLVPDLDDIFLPLTDGLFADPSDPAIPALLDALPARFADTPIADSAMGAAAIAGLAALSHRGGHLVLFQSTLPNLGPGALPGPPDEQAAFAAEREQTLHVPRDPLYPALGARCAEAGVGVSVVLAPDRFVDVASLATLPNTTGGELVFHPRFDGWAGVGGVGPASGYGPAGAPPSGYGPASAPPSGAGYVSPPPGGYGSSTAPGAAGPPGMPPTGGSPPVGGAPPYAPDTTSSILSAPTADPSNSSYRPSTDTSAPYPAVDTAIPYPGVDIAAPYPPGTDGALLASEILRLVSRYTAYNAVARVRCSGGLHLTAPLGAFTPLSATDLAFGVLTADAAFGAGMRVGGGALSQTTLDVREFAHIQCAVLYTTPDGHRRVRVSNLALQAVELAANVFHYADMEVIVAHMARVALARLPTTKLATIRDALTEQCTDAHFGYRERCAQASGPGQLVIPETLKGLLAHTLGLLKTKPLKHRVAVAGDARAAGAARMRSAGVKELVRRAYPRVMALHDLAEGAAGGGWRDPDGREGDEGGGVVDEGADGQGGGEGEGTVWPSLMRASYVFMEAHGVYLADNEEMQVLWVGASAAPQLLLDLFGVDDVLAIDPRLRALPALPTRLSRQVRAILARRRAERGGRALPFRVARQNLDGAEVEFGDMLVEDENNGAMAYADYMTLVHRKITHLLTDGADPVGFRNSSVW